ncbi:MarR family transcriptional regulator [Microbacterium sp. Leaf320]|uniref:MarR family transcriptional regulator n=1 Tax=Microbacterium sp. Leaf320 TaxID=1736334 RepID=UPI0006FF79B1|nr:MarR family transcriptional regulator [Microbacterium sp. Leaf320]KQQ65403.1 MarR family transcriptional regulator [Microbacterium sp. Leaf320]
MDTLPQVDALRGVSRSAFGQSYRLELMLAIARSEDGLCTLTELAQQTGVAMSSLQRPFQSLVDVGLISPVPDADSRYRYFLRNPSAAWTWAVELASAAQAR